MADLRASGAEGFNPGNKLEPEYAARFRGQLDDLLASEDFQRSSASIRLLCFLVEKVLAGEASSLKEVVIGHALYDRPADYDSKIDSVVRVNANRLRLRLEEHYRLHPEAEMRVVLRKGSYVPVLEKAAIPFKPSAPRLAALPQAETAGVSFADASELHEEFQPTSLADSVREPWKRQATFLAVGLAAGVAAIGLLLLFWWGKRIFRTPATEAATAWSVRPFARLGGSQEFSDFSPDGTTLVFASSTTKYAKKAIYIQGVRSSEAQRLTHTEAEETRPVWSPDAKRIAFLRLGLRGQKSLIVYELATHKEARITGFEGGFPWLCEVPRLSWSTDGATIYSSASFGNGPTCGIVAVDVATRRIRPLTNPQGTNSDMEVAASPDGTQIAFLRTRSFGNSDIYLIGRNGGGERRVTNDNGDIVGFAWEREGKSLLLASNRKGGVRRLWRVPVGGGTMVALTDGGSAPTFPAVGRQGQQIAFTQFHVTAPIWLSKGQVQVKLFDSQSPNVEPTLSPDGKRMLFTSDQSGVGALWISNTDGSDSRLLLGEHPNETGSAKWSPNGAQIIFECRLHGPTDICMSDADGGHVVELTNGPANHILPSWSRDGKSIYYTSDSSGQHDIYRRDLQTGIDDRVTFHGGYRAISSWDGKWIYVQRGQPQGGMVTIPTSSSLNGGAEWESRIFLSEMGPNVSKDWDAGKDGIVFREIAPEGSIQHVRLYDVAKHTSKPLFPLPTYSGSDSVSLAVAPNGISVIYTVAESHAELSLMETPHP